MGCQKAEYPIGTVIVKMVIGDPRNGIHRSIGVTLIALPLEEAEKLGSFFIEFDLEA